MDIKKAIEYAKVALKNLTICDGNAITPNSLEAEMWIIYRLYDEKQVHDEVIKMKKGEI